MSARLSRLLAQTLLMAALASLAVLFGRDGSPASAQTPPAGDAAAIRELAERLLSPPHYRGPDGAAPTIELLPASLPSTMPVDIPLPDGGRLIGSAVRGVGDVRQGIEVVADVAQPAARVSDHYRQRFNAAGWAAPYQGPGPRGFQPSVPQLNQAFCKSGVGYANVSAFGRENGTTDLRINYQLDVTLVGGTSGMLTKPTMIGCGGDVVQPVPPRFPPGYELLPALFAPDGVAIETTGGGGGPSTWTSEATTKTGMTSAALEVHFANQLATSGWKRTAGADGGPLVWSTWNVSGEGGPWQGLLFVLDGPGEQQRVLHVRVMSASSDYGYGRPGVPPMPYPVPMPAMGGGAGVAVATPAMAVPPAP
jgi:hypothetical protein